MKQEMTDGWQSHQLDHMQIICTSLQVTTIAPHHSKFYRPDALPDALPTVSKCWSNWQCCVLPWRQGDPPSRWSVICKTLRTPPSRCRQGCVSRSAWSCSAPRPMSHGQYRQLIYGSMSFLLYNCTRNHIYVASSDPVKTEIISQDAYKFHKIKFRVFQVL